MTRFPLLQRSWSFLLHVLLWTVTSLGSWWGMAVGLTAAGLLGFPYLIGIATGSVLGSLLEVGWHIRFVKRQKASQANHLPPG